MNRERKEIVALIMRRGWIILLVALTAGMSAYALTSKEPESYSATTVLLVSATVNDSDGLLVSQNVASTYRVLIKSTPFLDRVAKELNLPIDATNLREMISTQATSQPQFIEITVTDHDAQLSSQIANTIASEFQVFASDRLATLAEQTEQDLVVDRSAYEERIQEIDARLTQIAEDENLNDPSIQQEIAELNDEKALLSALIQNIAASAANVTSEVLAARTNVEVVEPATVPVSPIQPRPLMATVFGVIVGGAVGVMLVGIISVVQTATRQKSEMESLSSGTLSPPQPRARSTPLSSGNR